MKKRNRPEYVYQIAGGLSIISTLLIILACLIPCLVLFIGGIFYGSQ